MGDGREYRSLVDRVWPLDLPGQVKSRGSSQQRRPAARLIQRRSNVGDELAVDSDLLADLLDGFQRIRRLIAGRLELRGSLEDQRHLLIRELLLGGHVETLRRDR